MNGNHNHFKPPADFLNPFLPAMELFFGATVFTLDEMTLDFLKKLSSLI
jgi:hypothetical protein